MVADRQSPRRWMDAKCRVFSPTHLSGEQGHLFLNWRNAARAIRVSKRVSVKERPSLGRSPLGLSWKHDRDRFEKHIPTALSPPPVQNPCDPHMEHRNA